MSRHTPGPWRVTGSGIIGTEARTVARLSDAGWESGDKAFREQYRADARLIASAPDLFAVLERVANAQTPAELLAARNEARAAIARARGEG